MKRGYESITLQPEVPLGQSMEVFFLLLLFVCLIWYVAEDNFMSCDFNIRILRIYFRIWSLFIAKSPGGHIGIFLGKSGQRADKNVPQPIII